MFRGNAPLLPGANFHAVDLPPGDCCDIDILGILTGNGAMERSQVRVVV